MLWDEVLDSLQTLLNKEAPKPVLPSDQLRGSNNFVMVFVVYRR